MFNNMAAILRSIATKYHYVVHELADPRTAEWWGVSNPFIVLTIAASYLYFCKSLGPRLMSNRKPFELKSVLMLYNTFQVLFSMYLVSEAYWYMSSKEYSFACDTIDYSNNPRALRVAAAAWYYYFAKFTELLDTVFFVLRKKYNQVTFLHVYHHTLMLTFVWIGVKYFPGGHPLLMGALNSFVHVIMYAYYLIAGLGPEYQKYVWWKKHVTKIQLIQFCIVFVHNFSVFFYECNYPRILNLLACLNSVAFMYMFGKFYIQSYKKSKINKTALETKNFQPISSKVNRLRSGKQHEGKSR